MVELRVATADRPDRLWFTDITQQRATDGWVYCCAVIDAYSRQVVGWSITDHVRSELVVDALQMVRWQRRPEPGTVVHATAEPNTRPGFFGLRLRSAGLLGSMGRVASSVDNALIESFWPTMQRELLDRRPWATRTELAAACSSGSKAGTTPTADIPASATCHPWSSKPFTTPPTERHDQTQERVRKTESSSVSQRSHNWWVSQVGV